MPKAAALVLFLLVGGPLAALADDSPDELFAAAKRGDAPALQAALKKGVDVNARTSYGATALSFAASRGHLTVVQALIEAGAEINTTDTFYQATPIGWAAGAGHTEIVKLLLEHGASDVKAALQSGARRGSVEMVQAALDTGKVTAEEAFEAREVAEQFRHPKVADLLAPLAAKAPKPFEVDPATLQGYAGVYQSGEGLQYEVLVNGGKLQIGLMGRPKTTVLAKDNVTFARDGAAYAFQLADGQVAGFTLQRDKEPTFFKRVTKTAPAVSPLAVEDSEPLNTSGNWPSFRGGGARGVADGQHAPLKWDVEKSLNVRWRTPIEGLSHACPIVWGDKIFIVTAVSKSKPANLRTGLFGDVDPVEDEGEQSWQVLCLEKATGRILWLRIAHEGAPAVKRHPKSTHANPTPCTDGKHVVAFFASEGLYCYDTEGKLLWRKSLGVLDSGWFYDADYQWGFASSPIIFGDTVIVQCDIQQGSFIAAFRLSDGSEVWRTAQGDSHLVDSHRTRVCRGADAHHQRHALRPRLRPGQRPGVVALLRAFGNRRADAGGGPQPHLHRQRLSPHPADLRRAPRGFRRRVPRAEPARQLRHRLEPKPRRALHADADCLRRVSLRLRQRRRAGLLRRQDRRPPLPAAPARRRRLFRLAGGRRRAALFHF